MRIAPRPLSAAVAAGLAAALMFPATGLAQSYPPATDPGKGPKKLKPGGTLKVCKRGCRFKKIQQAIDVAGKGTTIRVGEGVYKEGLRIQSSKKDRIRLIGDPRNPDEIILEGRGVRGSAGQNGVLVNNADSVQINGFKARNFKGNGFFVVNANGYKLTNLIAEKDGVYGIYAFNSKGGEISKSEAYYHNDAGFYVGQTPPQTRPKRTTIKNVVAWGNVIGYSGTNSRYVTITRSKWFNNGVGLVPNVLESEKFMPHEDNAIVDNDIFWNNFNYFAGAPFKLRPPALGVAYPVGTGILLFGGRTTRVENNRIYGNYLLGHGQVSQFLLKPENQALGLLEGNQVRGNDFGLGGADLNGRDLFYDGSGSGNCFEGNTVRSPNVPSDNSAFVACGQPNSFNEGARNEALSWTLDADHEKYWVRNPHRPIEGIEPLERWTRAYRAPDLTPAGAPAPAVGTKKKRVSVEVGDYYFSPAKLTVRRNTTVIWKWPAAGGDAHDVVLKKGPRGVKRFASDVFLADERYAKKLTVPGRYSIICSLHPDSMRQTITVKR